MFDKIINMLISAAVSYTKTTCDYGLCRGHYTFIINADQVDSFNSHIAWLEGTFNHYCFTIKFDIAPAIHQLHLDDAYYSYLIDTFAK